MWREKVLDLHPGSIFSDPVSQDQFIQTEQKLGVNIPVELGDLLRETNGVTDEYGLGIVWSIERIRKENESFRSNLEFAKMYMSFDQLLFFADAGNGDLFGYVVLQGRIRSSNIFAWNHENDSRNWVAQSLGKYLEWWLKGKIKL